MQPKDQKDRSYLWDIKEACTDILEFTRTISFFEYEKSKLIRYSVERQIIVIGEAANHLSTSLRE